MSRFGCVTPSEGLDVTDRKACFLSLLAQAPVWLLELRVSQHFSTFYGSSVQSMDTQINALPTLPVLARTVSGCSNSAFLGLERNRSAVGKTKALLVATGQSSLPLHWRKFSIKAVRASD